MHDLDALVLSLPTRNSTLRMRVWRALKQTGSGALRDGVYVLPAGSGGTPVLEKMAAEIRSAGGVAMTVGLKLTSDEQTAYVRSLFDRGEAYGTLVRRIGATKNALARLGPRKAGTAVRRLRQSFGKLSERDFFPGRSREQAAEAMSVLEQSLREAYASGEPRRSGKRPRHVDPARYRKRVWATRRDPWVDRLASAWLIKRFIDRKARFTWLERPRDRPKRAVGFDFDGAEFTHSAGQVTFEVLVASFDLAHDPALGAIGAAVHFLDIGGIPVADAKGLETVLRGSKQKARDDDALLAESMRIFDLFYSAYGKNPA